MDKIERFVELLSEGDEKISLGCTDDDSGHLTSELVDHRPTLGLQKMILTGESKVDGPRVGQSKGTKVIRCKTGQPERT